MTSDFLDEIFNKAKLRFTAGAENHKDKPFCFQFDTFGEIEEELLDCINYCAMMLGRVRRIELEYLKGYAKKAK